MESGDCIYTKEVDHATRNVSGIITVELEIIGLVMRRRRSKIVAKRRLRD